MVLWLSTGILLLMVAMVAAVAAMGWALPPRGFEIDRFLAALQKSSYKDNSR